MFYNKRFFILVMCLLSFLALFAFRSSLPAAKGAAKAPIFITNYPLPNNGAPHYLVQTNDQFWFTAPGNNAIGSLVVTTTVDYAYTFYTIPTASSEPYDLVAGDGAIWFTERAGNKIGKLDILTGDITEYPISTPNSEPTGITIAPDESIWFVQRMGNKLSTFNPVTETFTEYDYPFDNAGLEDIAITGTGSRVWVTAVNTHYLSSLTVATAQFYHVPTSSPGPAPCPCIYVPSQVALDTQGNIWISTHNGLIGRYNPSTVQYFRWYRVSTTDTAIDGLIWETQNGLNQLWFTESDTGYAGQLSVKTTGSVVSNWRFPITDEGVLYGIVQDNDKNVWVADSAHHEILHWEAPFVLSAYLPNIMN